MWEEVSRTSPLILQTESRLADGTVSTMYGVAYSGDSDLKIFDLTHDIRSFNVWEASYRLIRTVNYWKESSVFASVVDPGVGTPRKASVALLKDGNYVVTLDNGLLTHLYYNVGIEAIREIDETVNRFKGTEAVSIFHGRDLFAYVAAKLASGQIDFAGVGPEYPVEDVPYAKSFGFVEVGEPVVFNSSSNYISIGLNQGSFKAKYGVKAGLDWKVTITKK